MEYFKYDAAATDYLKKRDKALGEAIDRIGKIERRLEPQLFTALVYSIIGQQISTKAQETICARADALLGEITPRNVLSCKEGELQSIGISFRKAEYIRNAAQKTQSGELDISRLFCASDQEVISALSSLSGVGVWTAEMLMIFSMGRPDILSYGDLAIHRGLRMLYHHRTVTKQLFEKYRRRYSPYASVASLYLWAIAGGAIAGMKDHAPKRKG